MDDLDLRPDQFPAEEKGAGKQPEDFDCSGFVPPLAADLKVTQAEILSQPGLQEQVEVGRNPADGPERGPEKKNVMFIYRVHAGVSQNPGKNVMGHRWRGFPDKRFPGGKHRGYTLSA
ncbi:hypothetical protein, partial [Desulfuromonas sp.]|uniref:hypothetical protein n=1 Tax=Desulfuromonas sp. TaxID=892 RepID=UPI00341E0C4D